ncbi:methenyltetrahydrofolate cyclohydrolase [Clostridium acetireducens DSM 10703]|jgi:formiminotetrahydrofolate cyclodeaminase|uniref:Methenyltetrahydrofolate cyclohydrolase n=1 Tax=Clostridium acetireducens DSM 10703 TaxID=1121290 RepID=A0A1E8EYQ7_9CLOT|nr:cyclodeaminase/cyclohydrolase family protein [Clostridium acetireducens]OFI05801.1 methenyltetrahydrofolate cyclohydrolase [Clostridium acetireducens DSM 10703]
MKNLEVKDFIDNLSSKAPTPGGGSVAALCASLSSALTAMVFNLTIGKKEFYEYDEDKQQIVEDRLKKVEEYKYKALELAEEDSKSFLYLMNAFKLPKSTEKEKEIRQNTINKAYINAVEVPFQLLRETYELYDCVYYACTLGNKTLVSDVGIAAILVQAVMESCALNIKINIKGIDNEIYNEKLRRKCDDLIINGNKRKMEIINIVNSKL